MKNGQRYKYITHSKEWSISEITDEEIGRRRIISISAKCSWTYVGDFFICQSPSFEACGYYHLLPGQDKPNELP